MALLRWMILTLCILALAGCSEGKAKKKSTSTKGTAEATATAAEAPPEVDTNSGLNLDGNRVRVFSPAGWRRASRSAEYLVRYQAKPQGAYPSVVVVAADAPDGFTAVTSENQKGFVAAVAAGLAKDFGGEGKPALKRNAVAATVGPHHAVTWSATGEAKLDSIAKKIDRECLAVVVGGRMYTVEAWAPTGKLDGKAKSAARAVAAALAVPSDDPIEPLVPLEPEPAAPPEPPAKPEPAAKAAAVPAKPLPPAK